MLRRENNEEEVRDNVHHRVQSRAGSKVATQMGPELVGMGLSHASKAMTNENIEHWGMMIARRKSKVLLYTNKICPTASLTANSTEKSLRKKLTVHLLFIRFLVSVEPTCPLSL